MLSVEQFEQFIEQACETADVSYELDQGELVEMAAPGFIHNDIRDEIGFRFRLHLKTHRDQGRVVCEQYFRIAPDTVLGPDVAFISREQVSLITPTTPPFSPALVIEIASPSNTIGGLALKTRKYLDAGTKAVWIVDTEMREVRIYSAGAPTRVLSGADRVEDSELLPGFSVTVDDLFDV